MTAPFCIGMTVSTSLAAVVLPILLYSIFCRNNTQTGFTGTFHCSYGSHDVFHNSVLILTLTYEHRFRLISVYLQVLEPQQKFVLANTDEVC